MNRDTENIWSEHNSIINTEGVDTSKYQPYKLRLRNGTSIVEMAGIACKESGLKRSIEAV